MPKAPKARRAKYAPRGGRRIQVTLPEDLLGSVTEAAEIASVTQSHYIARRLQDAFDREQRPGDLDVDHLLKGIAALFEKYLGGEAGGRRRSGGWRRMDQTDQSELTMDILTAMSGLQVQVSRLAESVEHLALAQPQLQHELRPARARTAKGLPPISGQNARSVSTQQKSGPEHSRTEPEPSFKPSF